MKQVTEPKIISLADGVNLDQSYSAGVGSMTNSSAWMQQAQSSPDMQWCGYGWQGYGGHFEQNFGHPPYAMLQGIQPGPVAVDQGMMPHTSKAPSKTSLSQQEQQDDLNKTTILFRNVPHNLTSKLILELLETKGFKNGYDFVYLPHDFKRLPQLVTLGYFFVNFVSHQVAQSALDKLRGYKDWQTSLDSTKELDASWATQTQGLRACIKRYRNCPVMHETVPAECKPMVFENGVLVPLAPTKKKIKQPRYKPLGQRGHELDPPVPEDQVPDPVLEDQVPDPDVFGENSFGVWMPDESALECSKCGENFTMFRRRHHCKLCGLVCCAECAPRTSSILARALTGSPEPTFKRLCNDCASDVPGSSPGRSGARVKNGFIDITEDPNFASRNSLSDSFPF